MPTLKVVLDNKAVTLTDKNYIAAGGEASVYKYNGEAIKIFHEPSKKMLPIKRIEELNKIGNSNVIIPRKIVYASAAQDPIGYAMRYLEDTEALCKLFTRTFKDSKAIDIQDIIELSKNLQATLKEIHQAKCLVVDLNELNILVSQQDWTVPLFIDTDSYQTPSFPATAIMESIRDPLVKNNNFTELSDWYSWGILVFQLFINIHPFKGGHPKYKPAEWKTRMIAGASVFDKGVKLPPMCNALSVIPKRYLSWMEDTFQKNQRSIPPSVDSSVPVHVPQQVVIIQGNKEKFVWNGIISYPGNVVWLGNLFGKFYANVFLPYSTNKTRANYIDKDLQFEQKNASYCCIANNGAVVYIENNVSNKTLAFSLNQATPFNTVEYEEFYISTENNALYCKYKSRLIEYTFTSVGNSSNNILSAVREVTRVSESSSKLYDNIIIQDLLGKKWFNVIYERGKNLFVAVKELDNFRIINARREKNVCFVIGESKGIYSRFIITLDEAWTGTYTIEITPDVGTTEVNFTVFNKMIIYVEKDELIISAKGMKKTIPNPPFDESAQLLNANGTVYFVSNDTLYSVTLNK